MNIQDPCKEGKCITYPLCLNKTKIDCPIIKNFIIHFDYDTFFERYYINVWKYVKSIFPKIKILCVNEKLSLCQSLLTGDLLLLNRDVKNHPMLKFTITNSFNMESDKWK